MQALEDRTVARLAGFPGFLRANGYAVGGGDVVPVLQTAARGGMLDAQVLRLSLRALLCGRPDEWRRFDGLFDNWFMPANRWQQPQRRESAHGRAPGVEHAAAHERDGIGGDESEPPPARRAASRHETLAKADFRTLTGREHTLDIEALMRRFARRLEHVRLRRDAAARCGVRLDLAGTIRRSVATGGTPLRLAWRDRRRVRPRLVLLIDVSRSMAACAFFHLRLARALAAELDDVHSFVFHTRVSPVTAALHDPDPWRAQERLHLLAQGFGGGTRIGESLTQFVDEHAGRLVHSRTAVLVFSDGYDTGDAAVLGTALARLRRRARRIVWLNPLAGSAGYEPVSAGMQAALPYLDLLAPAANLAQLEAVLPKLFEALR